ncbi:MAG: rhomboid family intramembrane serine protease [Salinivirgaceae bacterium]|nr:rhomboid family intramembrane serine protease [Salinivirgaceae bacterium]
MVLSQMGIDLGRYLALHNVQSPYFKPYQFVTHMFMHGSITHIFFNMFALFMFGRMLEMVWEGKRFLIYYFVTGLGAAALHSIVNYLSLQEIHSQIVAFNNTPSPELLLEFIRDHLPNATAQVNEFVTSYSINSNDSSYANEASALMNKIYELHLNIPTVGASGAVFGVLLAFGMLFPNLQLRLLFPPIPIRAKYFVIFYGAAELYAAVMQQPGDNVAHFAHLGGMVFGFLLIIYWNKKGIGNFDKF